MKTILTILSFILLISVINAQAKYDNIWLLNNDRTRNTIRVSWEGTEPDTTVIGAYTGITVGDPNASICNAQGELMFFSNGCGIAGRNYRTIVNGTKINPGYIYDNYCYEGINPYSSFNNIVFLPNPSDTSLYYLFHTARSENSNFAVGRPYVWFYYSEINTKKGLKYGAVTKKNVLLGPRDSLSDIGPYACKHANGKDWWVVVPTSFTYGFTRALLTADGPKHMGIQDLGTPSFDIDYAYQHAGQGVFSPDGSRYVRTDPFNGINIYNFDRCTGLMSNPIHIDTLASFPCSGVAISPNSRYMYITNSYSLYQYDLQANNIVDSRLKIADYDGFKSSVGGSVNYYKCQLAPNGKIYIASTNSSDYLSVIHEPDEPGLSCLFKAHDFKLPGVNYVGLPNMPHFRTPALQGVICPPVVATNDVKHQAEQLFELYPNPTKGNITLNTAILIENHHLAINVYDSNGKLCYQKNISEQAENFDLPSDLPPGFYFWVITDDMQQIGHGKVVLH